MLETERVLRGAYGFGSPAINEALSLLVGLPHVDVEDRAAVVKALGWQSEGMDFADALQLASRGRAASFATFDRALGRVAERTEATPRVDMLPG